MISETVIVALVAGGISMVSSLLTYYSAKITTEKQCKVQLQTAAAQNESQIQNAKIQADAQLQQTILAEMFSARQKVFAQVSEAYSNWCWIEDENAKKEAFHKLIDAINAAGIVAAPETTTKLNMFLDAIKGVYGSVNVREYWTDAYVNMQRDLMVYIKPTFIDVTKTKPRK